MKRIIVSFTILFFSYSILKSQDTIIKANNEAVYCKVTKITNTTIFYTENKIGKSLLRNEITYFSTNKIKSTQEKEVILKDKPDYKFYLKEDGLKNAKYDYSITKVIDARLNKKKPIGSVLFGMAVHKKTVGNDSIAEQMKFAFEKIPQCFNSSSPIVLVINQINLRFVYSYGKTETHGAKEELELNVSLDFYKEQNGSYQLLFKHYCSHKHNVSWEFSAINGVSMAFSGAIADAFDKFNKQLKSYPPYTSEILNSESFNNFLNQKPSQQVNTANLKEGIYLSSKDLYLNNPAIQKIVVTKDSSVADMIFLSLRSSETLLDKCYAVVEGKKIYIHFDDNRYKLAILTHDGRLFYADKKDNSLPSRRSIDFETGN